MQERTRNIAVGLTTLAAGAGLVLMLMLFGYLPTWFESRYAVAVELGNASGLSKGSRVLLDGIPAGEVESVSLKYTERGSVVRVEVRIHPEVDIPSGVRAHAEAPLVAGSPYLVFESTHLTPGTPDYALKIKPLPRDGSAVVQGDSETALSRLAAGLRDILPPEKVNQLVRDFSELSATWVKVGKNIDALTGATDPGAVDAGKAEANFTTVLRRADARLKELEAVAQGLDRWLNDAELRDQIRRTAANASEFSGKLNTIADKTGKLVDDAGQNLDRLARRYVAVADDLSAAVQGMRSALDKANSREGTLGKLLSDASLYDNLNDAVKRIGAAVEEMRQFLDKIKKEGLPLQ